MRVVMGTTPEDAAQISAVVSRWVAGHIPHMSQRPDFGACSAIGVVDDAGDLVGGCVYHNYYPEYGAIEMSFAATSSRWLTKSIISAMLAYPFSQLGCYRVTGVTPLSATSALRFLERFGFVREGIARSALGPGNDVAISSLLRPEWEASRFKLARPVVTPGGPEVHRKRRRRRRRGGGRLDGTPSPAGTGIAAGPALGLQ